MYLRLSSVELEREHSHCEPMVEYTVSAISAISVMRWSGIFGFAAKAYAAPGPPGPCSTFFCQAIRQEIPSPKQDLKN